MHTQGVEAQAPGHWTWCDDGRNGWCWGQSGKWSLVTIDRGLRGSADLSEVRHVLPECHASVPRPSPTPGGCGRLRTPLLTE